VLHAPSLTLFDFDHPNIWRVQIIIIIIIIITTTTTTTIIIIIIINNLRPYDFISLLQCTKNDNRCRRHGLVRRC